MVSEEKVTFSTNIVKERRKKFGIWCKIHNMTQEQGLAKLIDEHVPAYKFEVSE